MDTVGECGMYCNCEDCCYARGGAICATCGALVGAGCPEDTDEERQAYEERAAREIA